MCLVKLITFVFFLSALTSLTIGDTLPWDLEIQDWLYQADIPRDLAWCHRQTDRISAIRQLCENAHTDNPSYVEPNVLPLLFNISLETNQCQHYELLCVSTDEGCCALEYNDDFPESVSYQCQSLLFSTEPEANNNICDLARPVNFYLTFKVPETSKRCNNLCRTGTIDFLSHEERRELKQLPQQHEVMYGDRIVLIGQPLVLHAYIELSLEQWSILRRKDVTLPRKNVTHHSACLPDISSKWAGVDVEVVSRYSTEPSPLNQLKQTISSTVNYAHVTVVKQNATLTDSSNYSCYSRISTNRKGVQRAWKNVTKYNGSYLNLNESRSDGPEVVREAGNTLAVGRHQHDEVRVIDPKDNFLLDAFNLTMSLDTQGFHYEVNTTHVYVCRECNVTVKCKLTYQHHKVDALYTRYVTLYAAQFPGLTNRMSKDGDRYGVRQARPSDLLVKLSSFKTHTFLEVEEGPLDRRFVSKEDMNISMQNSYQLFVDPTHANGGLIKCAVRTHNFLYTRSLFLMTHKLALTASRIEFVKPLSKWLMLAPVVAALAAIAATLGTVAFGKPIVKIDILMASNSDYVRPLSGYLPMSELTQIGSETTETEYVDSGISEWRSSSIYSSSNPEGSDYIPPGSPLFFPSTEADADQSAYLAANRTRSRFPSDVPSRLDSELSTSGATPSTSGAAPSTSGATPSTSGAAPTPRQTDSDKWTNQMDVRLRGLNVEPDQVLISSRRYKLKYPETLQPFIVNANRIVRSDVVLGEGNFGVVYRATLRLNTSPEPVAVKTLKDNATFESLRELILEASCMAAVGYHDNIVSLRAAVFNDSPLLAIEFCQHGDLKSALHKIADCLSVRSDIIPMLYEWSVEIARGVEFLHAHHIIHRDLACRNVLLTECLSCKVSDFGLARDMKDKDYYRMRTQQPLPIRWLAPEILDSKRFTPSSDVWAYGVTVWEVFSLGEAPYRDISIEHVRNFLEQGGRLSPTLLMDDDMYQLLCLCWKRLIRPSISTLVPQIQALVNRNTCEDINRTTVARLLTART